jgi:hypothetical protein
MPNDQIIQSLVGLRGAVGAGAWLAPKMSGRLFGLDPDANPQTPYIGRLFGARDVALAYGVMASEGAQRAQWLSVGIACDIADAAAGWLAGRRGELPRHSAVMVTATAIAAAALGVAALQGERQST